MIPINWPVYALFGGGFGVAAGSLALVASLLVKRSWLTKTALALVVASVVAITSSLSSSYWEKPDCYLPDGRLDESREECRFSTTLEEARESP